MREAQREDVRRPGAPPECIQGPPFSGDSEYMDFGATEYPGGVDFHGAWVASPHFFSPDFWFDGYNGATFVGSSAHVTLTKAMQWVEAGFPGR